MRTCIETSFNCSGDGVVSYLHAYETVSEVRIALARYFSFHNVRRPHQSLEYRTPDEMYFATDDMKKAA